MRIGILSLQGCVAQHAQIFSSLGVAEVIFVRSVDELNRSDGLLLPGGESSTMLRLLERNGMFGALQDFGAERSIWGVCAGSILLAKEVVHPEQRSLDLMDLRAERNYYGSQLDSFQDMVSSAVLGKPFSVDFIRAPLLSALSDQVTCLGECRGAPVLFRQGRHLAASFHIELTGDTRLHQYFLEMCSD